MGQHADDAVNEVLDEMDFHEHCTNAGIDTNQDAMNLLQHPPSRSETMKLERYSILTIVEAAEAEGEP